MGWGPSLSAAACFHICNPSIHTTTWGYRPDLKVVGELASKQHQKAPLATAGQLSCKGSLL